MPTIEELQAMLDEVTKDRDKLKSNNAELADQLKARPTVAAVLDLIKGNGEGKTDNRIPPEMLETVMGLRQEAETAKAAGAKLEAKLKEQERAAADWQQRHGKLQETVDRGTFKAQLAKAGGDRLNTDMLEVMAGELWPLFAKGEDGTFSPSKDGKPWLHDGKPVDLPALLADIGPNGKGALLGGTRSGYFRSPAGSFPGDAGGGSTPTNTATGTGLLQQARELSQRHPGAV